MAPPDALPAVADTAAPSSGEPAPAVADPGTAMRAEHDRLAARLAVRRSVDEIRRASIAFFLGFLGVGLCGKLAWDRWGPPAPGFSPEGRTGPPFFLYLAVVATVVVLALSIRHLVRARRLLAEEERLFARFQELRAALGFGP